MLNSKVAGHEPNDITRIHGLDYANFVLRYARLAAPVRLPKGLQIPYGLTL